MKSRGALLAAALGLAALTARADTPPLLAHAMGIWTADQSDWAFLRRTRTLDDHGGTKTQKLEAYDPSLPDNARWKLVSVDGRPPTPEQQQSERKKNRKPRKYDSKPPVSLLDLPRATVSAETADAVTYEIPMKSVPGGLAQTSQVVVHITVDRQHETVERLTAQLRGPMRIALGLAKVTDLNLDLNFDAQEKNAKEEMVPRGGQAKATLSTFGERMEYEWWQFRAVEPWKPADG